MTAVRRGRWLAGWMLASLPFALAAAAEAPRVIRVVMDNAYAPYSFQSDDGKLQGILIDQWRAWETKTGIKVEISGMDWNEALRRMRAGEFDVIDSIVETEERRALFDFTAPHAVSEVAIFFRTAIAGVADVTSLKGFPVGVKSGDQNIDKLKAGGVTTLVPFQSADAMVAAAQEHKINVFVAAAPSVHYLLNKAGIADEFRQSAPISRGELRRAVRKGDVATLRAMTEGFAALDPAELKRIDEKWFGRTINWHRRYLIYAGYAVAAALLIIAGLTGWNRLLRTRVQDRTAALSESEQRFRQIAEHVHEVFWLTTVDLGKTLYVSPAYETIWGRSCESLYRDPRSFIAAIHPDDRARVVAAIEQGRAHGLELEYRVVRPDGSTRWISDRGFPIKDEAAQTYRIAGIAEDITERKLAAVALQQAEDRVRLMIDTLPTMAWSVRPDGTVDFVNRRWLDYTGLTLAEEIENPTSTIFPADLARVIAKWLAHQAAGESFEDELRLRRADGAYRWVLVRTVPLRDEHGKIVKWFGASIDIADRKEAEEALRRSEQQLHELVGRLHTAREDEAKRIARELHDDLGQKLTALNMELADLETKLPDATDGQRDRIARMHATVDQTIEAVQELSSELRLGPLDLLGLTAAIDWHLKEFSRRFAIPCHVRRLDETANLSDAQRTAVFRILQEALINVVRHAGATQLEVSLHAGPESLALWIRDNGRGVTATELFDRKAIGVLGMRERAQAVGGTVTVTGERGVGTTVFVTVPLAPHRRISA